MKKQLFAILLLTLFVTNANGQSPVFKKLKESDLPADSSYWKAATSGSLWSDAGAASGGMSLRIDTVSYLKIFAKAGDGSDEIIRFKYNGDLWFKPSEFCDCDKCRNHVGLKFLYNIYNKK